MTFRTRVKVCGLTNEADAAAAVEAGVDAVGVVFAPESPRRVTVEEALSVFGAVPPPVARVGVFVDAEPGFVGRAVSRLGLAAVQFHGDESPERCAAAPAPVIKALRVGTGFAPEEAEPYRGVVAAVLLDTYCPDKHGGTGTTFTWRTFTHVPGGVFSLAGAPVFLAGGLTPANVGEAITALRPFAVDVSSGVEASPRVKDARRVLDFIAAVRATDAAMSAAFAEGHTEVAR